MRKTPFAGITRLDPDESLLTDGGAFIGDDRDAIDYFLRLGAKTHRHDGSTGLDNPLQVASGGMAVQGGSLPADLSFGLGYTLVDENGGETMISPVVTISTAPPVSPPTAQATATVDYTGGSLLVGTYYYAVSLVDNTGGETPVGPAATASRAPGHASGRITVSDLADDITGNIVAWRLYRSVGGGDFNLLATGTGNTFVDDGSQSVDCDITPNTDAVNTTNGQNLLIVRLPSAVGDAEQINMYVSEDGSFAGDALLDTYPVASAGASAAYPTIELGDQAPPPTNRSVGGADPIDAEEDIINLHWLSPVANVGALPDDADEGDVRVVLATGVAYCYRSGDWGPLVGSGSGGGAVNVNLLGEGGAGHFDDFSVDDLTYYTPSVFTSGTDELEVSGGVLSRATSDFTSYLSGPDPAEDGIIRIKFTTGAGTLSDTDYPIVLTMLDADATNYVYLRYDMNDEELKLVTMDDIDFTEEERDSAMLSLSASTDYWIELKRDGNDVTGAVYDEDPEGGTPLVECTWTLTDQNADIIGAGTETQFQVAISTDPQMVSWDDLLIGGQGAGVLQSATAVSDIDLIAGSGISIDLDESPAGHARITISLA